MQQMEQQHGEAKDITQYELKGQQEQPCQQNQQQQLANNQSQEQQIIQQQHCGLQQLRKYKRQKQEYQQNQLMQYDQEEQFNQFCQQQQKPIQHQQQNKQSKPHQCSQKQVHIHEELNLPSFAAIGTTQINGINEYSERRLSTLDFSLKEMLQLKQVIFPNFNPFESTVSLNTRSRRYVSKDGSIDIKYSNIPGMSTRYIKDSFHTLLEMKWRFLIALFAVSFIFTWVFFGTIWYVIVQLNKDEKGCVDSVDSWISAFLFSIETQSTIGYGGRAVTPLCLEGILTLVVQTIIGMLVNCAMLGILFAKLARPKKRGKTTMYSENAVITLRDGQLCLMFRYVDLRHCRLLDTNIRVILVQSRVTEEGEFIPIDIADLKLTIDGQQEEYTMRLFPLFPVTIMHIIDEDSPFYTMSQFDLHHAEFEIISIIEGTVPTTGNSTEALTSYQPSEILWGHRFKPIFSGTHVGELCNRIDLSIFHETQLDDCTLPCSAKEFLATQNEKKERT